MIQRIQTLYLLISVILLGIITSGLSFWNIDTGVGSSGTFNVFGYDWFSLDGSKVSPNSIPLFVATSIISLLQILAIFYFKNLKSQLKIVNLSLVIYVLTLVFVALIPVFGKNWEMGSDFKFIPGVSFYLLIAGFIFAFLANRGIKKDKNLLDSLNRLR